MIVFPVVLDLSLSVFVMVEIVIVLSGLSDCYSRIYSQIIYIGHLNLQIYWLILIKETQLVLIFLGI